MVKSDIIPEWKVREACAQCMKQAGHARYFNEAPQGARQYIALVFYETVYPNDLTEELSEQCFNEVLQELSADDLLYRISREKDARTRDMFVERLAFLREEEVLRKRRGGQLPSAYAQQPANRADAARASAPTYTFSYNARRLDREVAAWKRRWWTVCVSIFMLLSIALAYGMLQLAVYFKVIRRIRW